MIETKIIMALTLRTFDISAAYDELDSLNPPKTGEVRKTPNGERAYQTLVATAKPVDGMPARVRRRSNA